MPAEEATAVKSRFSTSNNSGSRCLTSDSHQFSSMTLFKSLANVYGLNGLPPGLKFIVVGMTDEWLLDANSIVASSAVKASTLVLCIDNIDKKRRWSKWSIHPLPYCLQFKICCSLFPFLNVSWCSFLNFNSISNTAIFLQFIQGYRKRFQYMQHAFYISLQSDVDYFSCDSSIYFTNNLLHK